MDKLMSVCAHAEATSSATISFAVNPMFAPDDVFIPLTMTTALPDDGICQHCGEPYVYPR